MLELTNCRYPLLEKAFETQTKAIEGKGRKQVETFEVLNLIE